jgi:hypothetical protein
MDHESRSALQRLAGEEHGIPEQLHGRINGESLSELKADAQQLARQLGLAPPPQERGADGKFGGGGSAINLALRKAAGRA